VHGRVDEVVRAIFALVIGAVGRGRWRRSSLAAASAAHHGKCGGEVQGGATVEVVASRVCVEEMMRRAPLYIRRRQPRGAARVASSLTSLA
jgi:hypothetical protein